MADTAANLSGRNVAESAESNTRSLPSSRLKELWENHEQQMQRIDRLEHRLDDQAVRQRRRIANLLDETPTHRRSHLRLFVTHRTQKQSSSPETVAEGVTIVVEGKLLIGHLDHQSAAQVDSGGTGTGTSEDFHPMERSTDKSQYRAVGEREEDMPEKWNFTHFFDRVEVHFQTVFQQQELASPATPKKTSRSKRKMETDTTTGNLIPVAPPTSLLWTKQESPGDATAFFLHYTPERTTPQDPTAKRHSVTARISLYPTPGPEDHFKPSSELASALFPQHSEARLHKNTKGRKLKKRKSNEDLEVPPSSESTIVPTENDVVVPATLTVSEITLAFFHYIRDRKLNDESNKSLVLCDKLLTNLLGCESFQFCDLQSLLFSRNLLRKSNQDPIVITYVIPEASLTSSPTETTTTAPEQSLSEDPVPVVSFDMDIDVPGLFHYRVRELLRRIKRREFEYTSSRTKARYLLVASRANEELVKNKIEDVVCGRGYNSMENLCIFLALARSAPPNSEARAASQIDAKICTIVDRLKHHCRAANAAWDLVAACQTGGVTRGQTEEENNEKKPEVSSD